MIPTKVKYLKVFQMQVNVIIPHDHNTICQTNQSTGVFTFVAFQFESHLTAQWDLNPALSVSIQNQVLLGEQAVTEYNQDATAYKQAPAPKH